MHSQIRAYISTPEARARRNEKRARRRRERRTCADCAGPIRIINCGDGPEAFCSNCGPL